MVTTEFSPAISGYDTACRVSAPSAEGRRWARSAGEQRIPADVARQLARIGTLHKLHGGETLFVEGEPARHCYKVVSGLLKEFNTLKDGCCHISDFRFPAHLAGLSPSSVYHHTVEAIGETTLMSYPMHRFEAAAAESPALSSWLSWALLNDLERARANALAVSRLSAPERVARFLLTLTREDGPGTAPDGEFIIPMSRQDIADHLGLTIETVCRCLTVLKGDHLIRMNSSHCFTIPDRPVLEAFAGREEADGGR